MKINHVLIDNWVAPGPEWWRAVRANPQEELIAATIRLKLSWEEYKNLVLEESTATLVTLDKLVRTLEHEGVGTYDGPCYCHGNYTWEDRERKHTPHCLETRAAITAAKRILEND